MKPKMSFIQCTETFKKVLVFLYNVFFSCASFSEILSNKDRNCFFLWTITSKAIICNLKILIFVDDMLKKEYLTSPNLFRWFVHYCLIATKELVVHLHRSDCTFYSIFVVTFNLRTHLCIKQIVVLPTSLNLYQQFPTVCISWNDFCVK